MCVFHDRLATSVCMFTIRKLARWAKLVERISVELNKISLVDNTFDDKFLKAVTKHDCSLMGETD